MAIGKVYNPVQTLGNNEKLPEANKPDPKKSHTRGIWSSAEFKIRGQVGLVKPSNDQYFKFLKDRNIDLIKKVDSGELKLDAAIEEFKGQIKGDKKTHGDSVTSLPSHKLKALPKSEENTSEPAQPTPENTDSANELPKDKL
ncbi:hypothetical protein [Endozoicomonas elysicola]|uniref:Uncharacterized protein n=1 Tax=Endozoicomonas elysicola TaxID=305900 RepID=A0A081K6A7_9GAMM|nr:hypothetical protein [Endozoicomonas elysicola]KEI69683.1 hypothetical protein GV64_02025 [Endozoicomonas elysicola]